MTEYTHVLVWCPPWMCGGPGWSLQTRACFEGGPWDEDWEDPGFSRDAPESLLTAWAASQLRRPVTLTRGEYHPRLTGWRRRLTEPLYFIFPS